MKFKSVFSVLVILLLSISLVFASCVTKNNALDKASQRNSKAQSEMNRAFGN